MTESPKRVPNYRICKGLTNVYLGRKVSDSEFIKIFEKWLSMAKRITPLGSRPYFDDFLRRKYLHEFNPEMINFMSCVFPSSSL